MQASKLEKIVIHQKTCSKENKQDTVLENSRKVRDLLPQRRWPTQYIQGPHFQGPWTASADGTSG